MLTSKGEQSHDGTVLLTTCKVCLIDLPVREIQFLTQKGASLDPIMEVYSVVFGLLGIPFSALLYFAPHIIFVLGCMCLVETLSLQLAST